MTDDTENQTPPTTEPRPEWVEKREKDSAPEGYTYRLLLTASDLGERGQIVTLPKPAAAKLKTSLARVPTEAELQIGLS